MKLIVFGGTGGTGKNVVERALAAGHQVVAVARKPEALAARPGLTVVKGDVTDPQSLAGVFAGADAVVSAIGPASNSNPGTLISQAAQNLVAGSAGAGVKRLVFESGLMTGDGSELSFFGALAIKLFGLIYPKLRADKVLAEGTVQASALDWVIVRPPALDHSPAKGRYLAGPRLRVSPAAALSHADCADALLRACTEPGWVRQIVNVGRA